MDLGYKCTCPQIDCNETKSHFEMRIVDHDGRDKKNIFANIVVKQSSTRLVGQFSNNWQELA